MNIKIPFITGLVGTAILVVGSSTVKAAEINNSSINSADTPAGYPFYKEKVGQGKLNQGWAKFSEGPILSDTQNTRSVYLSTALIFQNQNRTVWSSYRPAIIPF